VLEVERQLADADLHVGLAQGGGVERVLVAEVAVDQRLADARRGGDGVDARAGVPLLGELDEGGVEDARASSARRLRGDGAQGTGLGSDAARPVRP
jgi:hypothetical protein